MASSVLNEAVTAITFIKKGERTNVPKYVIILLEPNNFIEDELQKEIELVSCCASAAKYFTIFIKKQNIRTIYCFRQR